MSDGISRQRPALRLRDRRVLGDSFHTDNKPHVMDPDLRVDVKAIPKAAMPLTQPEASRKEPPKP
jgi:hypothetical protein